jgi:hypothetical protein
MTAVSFDISMSLDGYIAAANRRARVREGGRVNLQHGATLDR